MTAPLLIAVLAVALGTALALAPGAAGRSLGAIRLLASAAVLYVVVFELIPGAWETLGLPGVAFGALWAAAPPLLNPLLGRLLPDRGREGSAADRELALELGYAALVVHRFADGVALATLGVDPGGPNWRVLVGLGAHAVPTAALMVLAFSARGGAREGLARAAGLAGASVAGIVLAGMAPESWVSASEPWIAGATAGLLLHVLAHEWRGDAHVY